MTPPSSNSRSSVLFRSPVSPIHNMESVSVPSCIMSQSALGITMNKINIILSGLLFITDSSGGSPSVGAAVGITNLFRPSAEVPLVSHSYPSYLDYPYQYSGNYDNSLELNTYFGNLLVDDKNDAEASYDDFISDVYSYSQDRQVKLRGAFKKKKRHI